MNASVGQPGCASTSQPSGPELSDEVREWLRKAGLLDDIEELMGELAGELARANDTVAQLKLDLKEARDAQHKAGNECCKAKLRLATMEIRMRGPFASRKMTDDRIREARRYLKERLEWYGTRPGAISEDLDYLRDLLQDNETLVHFVFAIRELVEDEKESTVFKYTVAEMLKELEEK